MKPTTTATIKVTVSWQVQATRHQDPSRSGHGRCASSSNRAGCCCCASSTCASRGITTTSMATCGVGSMGPGAWGGGCPVPMFGGSNRAAGEAALGPAGAILRMASGVWVGGGYPVSGFGGSVAGEVVVASETVLERGAWDWSASPVAKSPVERSRSREGEGEDDVATLGISDGWVVPVSPGGQSGIDTRAMDTKGYYRATVDGDCRSVWG